MISTRCYSVSQNIHISLEDASKQLLHSIDATVYFIIKAGKPKNWQITRIPKRWNCQWSISNHRNLPNQLGAIGFVIIAISSVKFPSDRLGVFLGSGLKDHFRAQWLLFLRDGVQLSGCAPLGRQTNMALPFVLLELDPVGNREPPTHSLCTTEKRKTRGFFLQGGHHSPQTLASKWIRIQ